MVPYQRVTWLPNLDSIFKNMFFPNKELFFIGFYFLFYFSFFKNKISGKSNFYKKN